MKKINLEEIKRIFQANSNEENAEAMSNYMRNKFPFYGIKKPLSKELIKPYMKDVKFYSEKDIYKLVSELWLEKEREMQYLALTLMNYYFKKHSMDIKFLEKLITSKSWWDTVDNLSNHTGLYFKHNFDKKIIDKWIESDNIWLNRSAILFQLKYKTDMDEELLSEIILRLKHKKEFFIQKAIGWVLREHSRYNPHFVVEFVEINKIYGLAKREALRIIIKNKLI